MTGQIHWHAAQAMIGEQLRVARERRRLEAGQQPLERLADDDVAAHERQRELVCASLLLSRREDPPTHQRSA